MSLSIHPTQLVLTRVCCPVWLHFCPSSERHPRKTLCGHLNSRKPFYSRVPKHSAPQPSAWNKSLDNAMFSLGITGLASGSDCDNHLISLFISQMKELTQRGRVSSPTPHSFISSEPGGTPDLRRFCLVLCHHQLPHKQLLSRALHARALKPNMTYCSDC